MGVEGVDPASVDLGAADPTLRQALLACQADELPTLLTGQRLILVLHALPAVGATQRRSAMGLVTMINGDGQRGLLAFTGLDALHTWATAANHPGARPYPQPGPACAQLAVDHGCTALVIDVLGPHRRVVDEGLLGHLAKSAGGSQ